MTRRPLVLIACALVLASACGPKPPSVLPGTPHYPEFMYPAPGSAVGLNQAADQRAAWNALQAGNLSGADRQFSQLLRRSPGNGTLIAGLGYVALARKDFTRAIAQFDQAIARLPALAPAFFGKGLALAQLGRSAEAIEAFEGAQHADPSLDLSARIDALRFRTVEDGVTRARAAAAAGKLDEARQAYEQALGLSPDSAPLLRELASVEQNAGRTAEALTHLEYAVEADPGDRASQVQLGDLRAAQGDVEGAARAYRAAQAVEPTADVEARLAALQEQAALAKMPQQYRAIPTMSIVSRGDLAAMLGVRLGNVLKSAPAQPSPLVTDTRGHWASPWIAMVMQAGVMEPFPNHTFLPAGRVMRADLAIVVSRMLTLLSARDPVHAARWQDQQVMFADLPTTHPAYEAASRATSAGVLDRLSGNVFNPSRPVSGIELQDAVSRLEKLAGDQTRSGQ